MRRREEGKGCGTNSNVGYKNKGYGHYVPSFHSIFKLLGMTKSSKNLWNNEIVW